MPHDMPSERVSDEQVRRIIARALEIESSSTMLTFQDIRSIASDLGIAPAAVDAAITEESNGALPRSIKAREWLSRVATALGMPLGFAGGTLLSTYSHLSEAVAWLIITVGGLAAGAAVLFLVPRTASLLSFNVRNLTLWVGIGIGGAAAVVLFGSGLYSFQAVAAIKWSLQGLVASTVLGTAALASNGERTTTVPRVAQDSLRRKGTLRAKAGAWLRKWMFHAGRGVEFRAVNVLRPAPRLPAA
jgi:hypothetical protein